MQETQVWSLGWEDPQENEMATHSSILAWEIPWREEPGGLQSTGSQKSWIQLSDWTTTKRRPTNKYVTTLASDTIKQPFLLRREDEC